MKKILSFFLVFVTVFLCGCSANPKNFLSDLENTFNGYLSTNTEYSFKDGIFIKTGVKDKEAKHLKETAVTPDGIHTLCYEKLNKTQKKIYRIMFTAANEMTENWFACGEKTKDYELDISLAYSALHCDRPELFWLPSAYMISKSRNYACVAFKYKKNEFDNDYLVTKEERDIMQPELEQKVSEILSVAQTLPTDYEKELFVHDTICNTATYNLDGGKHIYNAYGALVGGTCVCEGYSRAMQLIMQRLSIPCGLMYGEYNNEGHMWNVIIIGGNAYYLDTTWDDNDEYGALHEYFNITEEQLTKSHIISPLYSDSADDGGEKNLNFLKYPCVTDTENYYVKNGLFISEDINTVLNAVVYCRQSGKPFAELKIMTEGDLGGILQQVNRRLPRGRYIKEYVKIGQKALAFW